MSSSETQISFDLAGMPSAAEVLARIRQESRDESEKGRWFEQLFMRVVRQDPAFEIEEIWRWPDWPEREKLLGRDGRDLGIDLVGRFRNGGRVAVQCKCYDEGRRLPKGDIDSFLAESARDLFSMRWIVATCPWGENAERAIEGKGLTPPVGRIDFHQFLDVQVEEEHAQRPIQQPWAAQVRATENVVKGLSNGDRGQLLMACGTGKTFTSLRIAEQIVPEGGLILFAAPSIALVSQARRDWLRQTVRPLDSLVICSDETAGGRGEEDMRLSELECPVTTDPSSIADKLAGSGTRVVFCTYQSLRRVIEAQQRHGAPAFDLALADEAHRTTGAKMAGVPAGQINFLEIHHNLKARKRLYMTATPRIYTESSKSKLADKGVNVIDMDDYDVYGPVLHRLSFKEAVDEKLLSDYRVIVLGVHQVSVTTALQKRLQSLDTGGQGNAPTVKDMTRVMGVSLAVNGITEGKEIDRPGRLQRTMAFANTIRRSQWYAEAFMESEVLRTTTRRLQSGQRAMRVEARHLDASASALTRNRELRALRHADREGECRILCNVRLFTEGVDVPSLDAVAFLDPRNSQIDVVQAVGRVMRKAEGKTFGYIVVPVVIEPGQDVIKALEVGTDGYSTVGRVLRALQSHDARLAETPAKFIRVYEPVGSRPGSGAGGGGTGIDPDGAVDPQGVLDLREAEGIYAHVMAASGLGKPGKVVADSIEAAVHAASAVLRAEELEEPLAAALGLTTEEDGGAKGVCTVAALMLANACLLQRRLCDEPSMKHIKRLDGIGGEANPGTFLYDAWQEILKKDYKPVFEPGVSVLEALPEGNDAVDGTIKLLADRANSIADSLSDLGYDHSGPLYHHILGSGARSDGAFYTNNVSALMLARLALGENFANWSDPDAIARLRIMDPACGTGTLLMAAMQVIKSRARVSPDVAMPESETALHRRLVEDVLCGLDINRHGIQLAATNLTLGAPSVNYRRMNLFTLRHGPQPDGSVKAGALEILDTAGGATSLDSLAAPLRSLEALEAEQVDNASEPGFPLENLDLVVMNPPFTEIVNQGSKYPKPVVNRMQQHQIGIRDRISKRDSEAGEAINHRSVRTFFTPLADRLLKQTQGAVASVAPVTAFTSASGEDERRFLAARFHVERIVTSHDPKRINFSENTDIHECLMVLRRRPEEGGGAPTEFVSLRRMPTTADEAIAAADAIAAGNASDWGQVCHWSADRVAAGDWTPVQWYDGALADTVLGVEKNTRLEPAGVRFKIGPIGQVVRVNYQECEEGFPGAVRVFYSVSAKLRRTMRGDPEDWRRPKPGKEALARRYWAQRSHFLVAQRFRTTNGLLTGLWSPEASIGSGWVPVAVDDEATAKALAAWWNSTPVRLMLLNRRSKTLDYPAWSLEQLREIRIPKPDNPAWGALKAAFEAACEQEFLPMKQAEKCRGRAVIDEAAALALGLSPEVLADWRRRLAAEPTISNRPAP